MKYFVLKFVISGKGGIRFFLFQALLAPLYIAVHFAFCDFSVVYEIDLYLSYMASCCGTMEQVRATEGTLNILNFNERSLE